MILDIEGISDYLCDMAWQECIPGFNIGVASYDSPTTGWTLQKFTHGKPDKPLPRRLQRESQVFALEAAELTRTANHVAFKN